jgi:serine O-acetyltransferase
MSDSLLEQIYYQRTRHGHTSPDQESVEEFINELFAFLFLSRDHRAPEKTEIQKQFDHLRWYLASLLSDVHHNASESQRISDDFFTRLPTIYNKLLKDAQAIAHFDPAANSLQEVFVAYPGFFAIAVYRWAHALHEQHAKTLPRLFTEYAHRRTGIDIHPGAVIGESFFIDHGTGIVIGETAILGDRIKIYQGVTIGGLLDTENTQDKRHPTIEDDVIIYANATILGGNTIIGKGSTIGGNVWLINSVEPSSFVCQKNDILPLTIHSSLSAIQLKTA